jgi:hypothetical protein
MKSFVFQTIAVYALETLNYRPIKVSLEESIFQVIKLIITIISISMFNMSKSLSPWYDIFARFSTLLQGDRSFLPIWPLLRLVMIFGKHGIFITFFI